MVLKIAWWWLESKHVAVKHNWHTVLFWLEFYNYLNRKKANWIGDILSWNFLLKHTIEGNIGERIEVTGRQGRRRKQLLDDLKVKRVYCKLKKEGLDRTVSKTRFVRGCGRGRRRKQPLDDLNTLRTGLLNCLNARSRGLTFRHRASCI